MITRFFPSYIRVRWKERVLPFGKTSLLLNTSGILSRFCVFGTEENKDIMIEFLSLITQLNKDDFDDVRINNNEQIPRFYNDKTGWLDIKIRLNDGRKIDVEMSFSDRHPCLSENTSFAIRQNIAAARNHRRPWRNRYG